MNGRLREYWGSDTSGRLWPQAPKIGRAVECRRCLSRLPKAAVHSAISGRPLRSDHPVFCLQIEPKPPNYSNAISEYRSWNAQLWLPVVQVLLAAV
jgi:hypothetical protein